MKRDLHVSIDSSTQELKDWFEQLYCQKHDFLIPTNLIDEEFEIDEEQYINMVDRLKFIIKYGFKNLVPNLMILLLAFLPKLSVWLAVGWVFLSWN